MTEPAHYFAGARSVSRKLALQALYRWQLNAGPWQELVQEFRDDKDMARADQLWLDAGNCGVHVLQCALRASPFVRRFWPIELPKVGLI